MHSSTYTTLTLNVFGYNNPLPLSKLKTRLDEIYFGDSHRPHQWFLTANGRSAIYLFLKSLNLPAGSEVLVQSFTCVTAVNPILWAGLVPVYVDINPDTLSAAPESLQSRISSRTKLIMLQHTFGAPGALKTVLELAKKHGLIVLEDCAHALGAKTNNQPLGTFGDAAIISFGIEKTLSTKLGGALLVNNLDLIQSIEATYRKFEVLPRLQTFLWLIYPVIRKILRKLPPSLAKAKRWLLENTGILKRSVNKIEYSGGMPKHTLAVLPGVHAKIILDALSTLDANLKHRQDLSNLYQERLSDSLALSVLPTSAAFIKFPVVCRSAELRNHLLQTLTSQDIYATKWYDPPLYPAGTRYAAIGYNPDSCPQAQSVANRILNLPTGLNITRAHATIIANEVIAAAAQFSPGVQSPASPS